MRRIAVLVGLILIVAAAVWYVGIRPRLSQRFPDGWRWEVNTVGQTAFADSGQFADGTTLADDPINVTVRTVTAESDSAPAGRVNIEDHFITRDPLTNAVQWEYTASAVVDSITGQYVEGDEAGDYYFLPPNPARTTYTIRNSSYQGIPVTFQREETVSGIPTYLYAYYGDLENASAYPDQPLEDNQTILCFDFQLEYWVEPTTGEIVKYREWCEGDWVVNTETNERLFALSRWGGESAGDDLIRQAGYVQNALNQQRLGSLYIPLALAVVGLVALGVGVAPLVSRRAQPEAMPA